MGKGGNINLFPIRMLITLTVVQLLMAAESFGQDNNPITFMDQNKTSLNFVLSSVLTEQEKFYPQQKFTCKEYYFGTYVKVGRSVCYGNPHKIIKLVNEDIKFDVIKPEQVLRYLQKENFIDVETGKIRVDQDGIPAVKLFYGRENQREAFWLIFKLVKTQVVNAHVPVYRNVPPVYLLFAVMDASSGEIQSIDMFGQAQDDPQLLAVKLLRKLFLWQNANTADKIAMLQIVTEMRSPVAEELAIAAINSNEDDLIYAGINGLGWLGKKSHLYLIDKVMSGNDETRLRARSARAMEQIGHNDSDAREVIFLAIFHALKQEKNPEVAAAMMLTVQNLRQQKYGLSEDQYGRISGDIEAAKQKCMRDLHGILHS